MTVLLIQNIYILKFKGIEATLTIDPSINFFIKFLNPISKTNGLKHLKRCSTSFIEKKRQQQIRATMKCHFSPFRSENNQFQKSNNGKKQALLHIRLVRLQVGADSIRPLGHIYKTYKYTYLWLAAPLCKFTYRYSPTCGQDICVYWGSYLPPCMYLRGYHGI